jgi:hypothetical protein
MSNDLVFRDALYGLRGAGSGRTKSTGLRCSQGPGESLRCLASETSANRLTERGEADTAGGDRSLFERVSERYRDFDARGEVGEGHGDIGPADGSIFDRVSERYRQVAEREGLGDTADDADGGEQVDGPEGHELYREFLDHDHPDHEDGGNIGDTYDAIEPDSGADTDPIHMEPIPVETGGDDEGGGDETGGDEGGGGSDDGDDPDHDWGWEGGRPLG